MFSAARRYAKLVRKSTRELLQKLTSDSIARRASVVFDNAKNPVFMADARRRTAGSQATQFTILMSKMVFTPFNSILRIPTPWPTIPCRTAKAAIALACRVAMYMVTIFTTKPIWMGTRDIEYIVTRVAMSVVVRFGLSAVSLKHT